LTVKRNEVYSGFMALPQAHKGDKRLSARLPWVANVETSLPFAFWRQAEVTLHCATEDIGEGGVQILSSNGLLSGDIVRCVFVLSDNSASIPTLMRVRWSAKSQETNQYRIGLQFVI
jgi:hypothetical protein